MTKGKWDATTMLYYSELSISNDQHYKIAAVVLSIVDNRPRSPFEWAKDFVCPDDREGCKTQFYYQPLDIRTMMVSSVAP